MTKFLLPMMLGACLLLVLAACSQDAGSSLQGMGKGRERTQSTHLVETVEASLKQISHAATRTGTLRAQKAVKIFNQEEGRVTKIPHHEGDFVQQGDILIRMDDTLLQAQLDKAEATRRQAEEDLNRLKSLVKRRLAAEDELARADTAVKVAQAEETLRTRLGYTTIRAPFAGVITTRLVEPGDVAPRYTHLLDLIDPKSLVTEVEVSELLLPLMGPGDSAEVRIDALPNRVFSGKILRIHPTIDNRTRQGTVEVQLSPVPDEARAGQLCRVTLTTPPSTRLVVPFSALRRDENNEYVFVVDSEGKAHRHDVHSGIRHNNEVEIREGVEPGDTVVTKGLLGLRDGMTVASVSVASATNPEPATAKNAD
jgi:RND family efflux transporter MFP subunit